jgi:hypothetical protein
MLKNNYSNVNFLKKNYYHFLYGEGDIVLLSCSLSSYSNLAKYLSKSFILTLTVSIDEVVLLVFLDLDDSNYII